MHIVLICREFLPTLRGGGIASYMKEVSEGYALLGHKVTVICASDNTSISSDTKLNGVRIIRLSGGDFIIPSIEGYSIIKKFRILYRFHSYRKKIRKAILQLDDVDIIEVPEFGAESYYLHDLNIPIVMRLHTASYTDRNTAKKKHYPISKFYSRYLADLEEKEARKMEYLTSCSQSLKDWTVKYFGIPEERIKVIYNPIKTQYWTNKEYIDAAPKALEYKVFYAGTVAEAKGIEDLIKACEIVRKNGINLSLTIAGKLGQYGEHLKQAYSSEKWCDFLGNLPREVLKENYMSCDVACFPSWWEAMGLVCTEAMACGCIVIGSNSGGMSEIIEDGIDGFLTPPCNPQILAKIIEKTSSLKKDERKNISMKAQRKVQEKFSNDIILEQFILYYQQIIDNEKRK